MTEVKLSRLPNSLETLSYPCARETAAAELADVTVLFADGEAELGPLVEGLPDDEFDSADDLQSAIYGALPTEAVGEPGQSEGDA